MTDWIPTVRTILTDAGPKASWVLERPGLPDSPARIVFSDDAGDPITFPSQRQADQVARMLNTGGIR